MIQMEQNTMDRDIASTTAVMAKRSSFYSAADRNGVRDRTSQPPRRGGHDIASKNNRVDRKITSWF